MRTTVVLHLSFLLIFSLFLPACSENSKAVGPVDGNRAFRHVEKIVSFGPHPPGSEAQKKVARYLISQLREYGLEIRTDEFLAATPEGRLEMMNITGVLPGSRDEVIMLASHYDSKLFKNFEFVGANDSGSSCGVVLELARVLALEKTYDFSFWFVFFDGEEAFRNWTELDSLYGSRQFVRSLQRDGKLARVKAVILLDLIGGKDLLLEKDINSDSWLNSIIWQTAQEIGAGSLFRQIGTTYAVDDHIPFKELGIPVVDIIDLKYSQWHKPGDTLEQISPENMQAVGNVVFASLPKIIRFLDNNR